ncbi:MAG: hypothetical protein ABI367_09690 [Mucilaginibacter sp.]
MKKPPIGLYAIFFMPWLLAELFGGFYILSYLIAWLGSFFIFYLTLTGKIKELPDDRKVSEQLMRPIFLVQIVFAGYMCCTSFFYFLDVLGYQDFHKNPILTLVDQNRLMLTAQCQRYYCLAHASFVTGVLLFMKYPNKQRYHIDADKIANLLLITALISLPVSIACYLVPGLSQFYFQLGSLSFIAGTLALAYAIPLKKMANTIICLILYFFNFYQALISGYKEPIIISVLVLGIFLYPNYKKVVTYFLMPFLLCLFMLLPTYNRVFRENSWTETTDQDEARSLAIDAVLNSKKDKLNGQDDSNWEFYAFRLSEIDMFTIFAKSTPAHIGYYGLKLLEQSFTAIIPRAFWPSKPSTEDLVMERVYDAGVVYRGSSVSAKPAFVVDAYLSGGPFGIVVCLLIYGATAQLLSIQAEKLFGGYVLGTALIFSGLFQILWRGLSFEFLINSVFWSYITMLVIFKIFKTYNVLEEV